MKKLLLLFTILYTSTLIAQTTPIPDNNFEQALIDLGIDSDGLVNGQILNSDAASVILLDVSSKNINSLNGINIFIDLENLNCLNNNLTSLDLSNNSNLKEVRTGNNQLTNINVNGLTKLELLDIYTNSFSSIDVSTNSKLRLLSCFENQLTNIDLSSNSRLRTLNCRDNQLITLDLSMLDSLEGLLCQNNQLTSITFSNNSMLEYLNCDFNQLASLNLSFLNQLEELTCSNNQLTELNIKNGNNINVTTFYSLNNPNLNCIEVDDPAFSANSNNWSKDGTSSYSNNCMVSINNIPTLEQLTKVFPSPSSGILTVEVEDQLSYSMEVLNPLGQSILSIPTTQLRTQNIDLTRFPKGGYWLRISNSKQTFAKKIILN